MSSSGGVLLDLLAMEPWWSRHDVTWVSVRAVDTEAALGRWPVVWNQEHQATRPLHVLAAAGPAWRHLHRMRPDVVVSAGTGVAVPYFLAAKSLGIPTLWVETLNLVGRPGLAARVCMRLASRVLVQRPGLVPRRRRAVRVGELY